MNLYYEPKQAGFELVGMIEEDNLSYEFNMLIVLRNLDTGKIYVAADSGCSCPSPFEDTKVEDLEHVTSIAQLQRTIDSWNEGYDNRKRTSIDEVKSLLEKVKPLLRKRAAASK
jgi:hypothetical protein